MVEIAGGCAPVVAAIGNFDGVHLGHQFLLAETRRLALKLGAQAGVIVFDPHPRRYFQPDTPPFLLTASDQRDSFIKTLGVPNIFRISFDDKLAALSPEAFVEEILVEELALAGVVTGEEFQFGAKRAGNAEMLAQLCDAAGIIAHAVSPKIDNSSVGQDSDVNQKIGSSGVRQAISDGEMLLAARLLGRPWEIIGCVIEGQKLGRTLGFATANILLNDYVAPRHGVYAVAVDVEGSKYHGVANYGRRPTVGSDAPLLEVHLLNFEGDLYGKSIGVSFMNFIREERKFDGLDALKSQIEKDRDQARKYFGAEK